MFRFADPIWLLLGIIPVWMLVRYFMKRGHSEPTILFPDTRIFRSIGNGMGTFKRIISVVLVTQGIALLIFAMARPQTGQTVHVRTSRGIDIVLALDISSSMEAMDFDPLTRFEAAKNVVSNFIKMRTSDRIGLVVFAAQSFTLCPLTLDYDVVAEFLDRAEDARLEDGTAIGSAVATSVNRLRDSNARSRVVILLTDGMNNRGNLDPLTAARIAETLGIRIYTVGVGSEGRAPIRIDGRVMYTETHIDEETLSKVAEITGGMYFRAKNPRELETIYDEIDRLETTEIKSNEWIEFDEQFPDFLWAGFTILLLSFILNRSLLRRLP